MKLTKKWFVFVLASALAIAFAVAKLVKKPAINEKTTFTKVTGTGYFTCPMHPQIHLDHPGECPICHMRLVQVKAQQMQGADAKQTDSRSPVVADSDQLTLVGVQKHEVEKMNLRLLIPVSGRFVSSNEVAFQIYESDLRYVKRGLLFKGESSVSSEDELNGVIASVDSIVDPTSRTVRVVGSIKKGPRDIPSETGFRGDIEIDLKDRIAIPESSVLHTGTGDLVYVLSEGNKLTAKEVRLGQKTEGFFDVVSGLKPGEVISSGPNFLIDSEAKIRGAQ